MTQAGGGGRQPIAASAGSPAARPSQATPPKTNDPSDPFFVFVQHTAFADIDPHGANYMGYDYLVPAVPAVGTSTIGTFAVPAQQMLDISEINFVVTRALPGGMNMAALGDWFFLGTVSFTIDISGVNPWDQFTIYPAGNRVPGWCTINQNLLASWSAAPVHLVVQPGRTVTLRYTQQLPLTLIGGAAPDAVIARVRGRWLDQGFYKKIVNRQV
jgi:hypothetical protein